MELEYNTPVSQDTPLRRIVSYFEHEFIQLTDEKMDSDTKEMTESGFSQTVLTVSETDMLSPERTSRLKAFVGHLNSRNIEVWADPWHLGGVHGGEAVSHFEAMGEKGCICNPKLDYLVKSWLETVSGLGIDKVFWDEPEMKCQDHSEDEVQYLETYSQYAKKLGLRNAVCLTANQAKKWQLEVAADNSNIEEIATDPYFPNAFDKNITELNRHEYILNWATDTKEIADKAGKLSHVWVQTFNVPRGKEGMVSENIDACRQAMIDIALWGFGACKSVPDFITSEQAVKEYGTLK
jgi:hypothetical protein